MRRLVCIAAVIVASALLPATAGAQLKIPGAGVEVAGPNTGVAVSPDATSGTVRDNRRTGGQTLRCWQFGKLLYESSGFRGGTERNPSSIAVPRRGEGDAVTVFDLKDAICILSD